MQGFTVPDSDRIGAPRTGGIRFERVPQAPPAQTPTGAAIDREQLEKIRRENEEARRGSQDKAGQINERRARIKTSLDNLDDLTNLVKGSWLGIGVGNTAGTGAFQAIPFLGQTSANVAGSIEMVQGDLINQVRQEMQDSGAPIGVKGADTEKEAQRLAASIANLAQTQDEPEFLQGVDRARQYYTRRLQALDKEGGSGQTKPAQKQPAQSGWGKATVVGE